MLVAALASAGHGCHAILGPSKIDANWKVIDSPHFAFHVRPGSFAEQNIATLIEVLEDQYAFELSALDIRYAGRISLFLYNNAADAGEPPGSERSGTAYVSTEAARAIVSPPLESTFGLIAHESNHVIQYVGIGPPATSFMNEGMASAVISDRYYPGGKSFLYPWTARNDARIPPMTDLVVDSKWDDVDSQIAYNASASFLAYTLDTGGPDRLKQLQAVRSEDFADRFQRIYGKPLDQAEREWRDFCASFRQGVVVGAGSRKMAPAPAR
jgi:hypothetical protein